MSVRVMADVWDFGPQDATLTNVLVVLANSADDAGGNCFPGTALIAKRTRYSERTVILAIAELERQGWITVLQRGAGRPKGSNRWERAAYMSQYVIHVEKLKRCQDVTIFEDEKKVTLRRKKVTLTTGKGDFDDNPPHPLIGVSVSDPSAIQKTTPPDPLASEGETEKKDVHTAGCDGLVANVMHGCGFDGGKRGLRGLRNAIAAQLQQRVDAGAVGATVALDMIAAWKAYVGAGVRLRSSGRWGPTRFYAEGHWRFPDSWPWDAQVIRDEELAAEARVGSYAQ